MVSAWAMGVFVVAIFADLAIPAAVNSGYTWADKFTGFERYLTPLVRFDAAHYLRIALAGYRVEHAQLMAFFPLWPLVIGLFSFLPRIILNPGAAVTLVAVLLPFFISIGAALVTFTWFRQDGYSLRTSLLALALILAFPFSFFYLAPYTEALFWLLLGSTFLAARRGMWLIAGVLGLLTTALRLPGIVIVPALLIEYIHQKNWNWKNIKPDIGWLMIPLAGMGSYFLYLQLFLGGWQKYFEAYKLGWPERTFNLNIFAPFWRIGEKFLQSQSLSMNDLLSTAAVILAVYLLVKGYRAMRLSYVAYCLAAMTLPLITTSLDSTARYYMLLLPLYPVAATLIESRPLLQLVIINVSGLLAGLLIALFVNGYFVA